MKIISFISTLPPQPGVSPYTLELIKSLRKKIKIEFIGFKKVYPKLFFPIKELCDAKPRNYKIENLKIRNILTYYNLFSAVYAGVTCKGEVVHAQWWSWFLAPIYLIVLGIAKLRGKKIIITVHNIKPHEKSLIKNLLNISVLSLADEYVVHSKYNRDLFLEETKTKKIVNVIPHGVINIEKSKLSREILKKKYGFSNKNKIILFFGNIRDYKGLDILLESLKYIKDKNFKLIVAGKPWNDFERYFSLIEKYNLTNKIKLFLEFNSDKKVAELFKMSDLTVFPYKEFEASSGAGTLALNFERSIIVTNVGGLPELVKDKNCIVKPNNPKDLAKAIIRILKDKELQKKLEQDSAQLAKKFNWDKIAEETISLYRKLLK